MQEEQPVASQSHTEREWQEKNRQWFDLRDRIVNKMWWQYRGHG